MNYAFKSLLGLAGTVCLGLSLPALAQQAPVGNQQGTPQLSPDSTQLQQGYPQDLRRGAPNPVPGPVDGTVQPQQSTPGTYPNTMGTIPMATDGMSIDEIVRMNNSFELFNALVRVAVLEDDEIAEKLSGDGEYTVYVPTDYAFASTLPAGTIKQLVQPENRELLVSIINNHIVEGGAAMTTDTTSGVEPNVPDAIGRANPGSTSQEVPGATVPGPVTPDETTSGGISTPMPVGSAQMAGPGIRASNGVILPINQVLLPAGLQLGGQPSSSLR